MKMRPILEKEVLDTETGEVYKVIGLLPEARDKDFLKVYKLFSEKVLQDLGSMNGETRLLMWFIAQSINLPTQSEMWIPIDYLEVAKEIGVSKRSMHFYIKKLIELGYIEQYSKRQRIFRLKPDFVYRGILTKFKEDELSKTLKEIEKREA